MTNNDMNLEEGIQAEIDHGGSLVTADAIAIAAQMWCDERTEMNSFDPEVAMVMAEKIDEYLHALSWCGAAPIFSPGGEAYGGYLKVVMPLLGTYSPPTQEGDELKALLERVRQLADDAEDKFLSEFRQRPAEPNSHDVRFDLHQCVKWREAGDEEIEDLKQRAATAITELESFINED